MPQAPVTRAILATRILQRANTSGYVDPTTELPSLIDTSLAKLHNLLAELYEDYRLTRAAPFQLVPNQYIYPLASDYMKMRAVFYLIPSTSAPTDMTLAQRILLPYIPPTEQGTLPTLGSYPNQPMGYSVENNNLVITPVPGSGTQYWMQYWYQPQYVPAENDNTPINFQFCYGWEEWVVHDVCIAIRIKAMLPTQELMAERAAFEERVRLQAKNRNALEPHKVRNTGWRYGNNFPPWGNFSFQR